MTISITSVLTGCVLGSFLIIVFCILFKRTSIMHYTGPQILILIMLLLVIRVLLSFEYSFTYSIYLSKIWPAIRRILFKNISFILFDILLWQLLLAIWIIGASIITIKKSFDFRKVYRVTYLAENFDEDILTKVVSENIDYPEIALMRIVYIPLFGGPAIIGIKNPIIILHKKDWGFNELSYVLKHEIMHYRRNDILYKIIIDFLCSIFWWNPVFYYLKKQLFYMIEIKNDLCITEKMNIIEKEMYVECLIKVAKDIVNRHMTFTLNFSKSSITELERRLNIIVEGIHPNRIIGGILGICMLVLIFFSTCIIFEPESPPPIDSGEMISGSNSFLVEQGTGIYDVYVKSENAEGTDFYYSKLFSTDDLAPFKGVKIIKKEEFNEIKKGY